MPADTAPRRAPSGLSRLLTWFAALAVLTFLVLAASLLLGERLRVTYATALRIASERSARLEQFARLGDAMGAVRAPEAEAFVDSDPARASAQLDTAVGRYRLQMTAIRLQVDRVAAASERDTITRVLDSLERRMTDGVREAWAALAAVRAGRRAEAGRHAARMDAHYGAAIGAQRRLVALQRVAMRRQLRIARERAEAQRKYDAALAVAALGLLVGLVVYGTRLSSSIDMQIAARDRKLEQLAARERELRTLGEQLEHRVRERTAELEVQHGFLRQAAQENARLAAIVHASRDAIYSVDREGRITSWNAGAERMLGYTADEVVGRPLLELLPPEGVARIAWAEDQLRRGAKAVEFESVARRRDGTALDFALTYSQIVDDDGAALGRSAVVRDVTALKVAERQRREREAQLAEAQHIAHVGSWERSFVARESAWSAEMYRLFGYEPGHVRPNIGALVRTVHPDDAAPLRETIERALATRTPFHVAFRRMHTDGTERQYDMRGRVVLGDDGAPAKLTGIVMDVTEQRRVEAAERAAREAAESASRAKSEFLANMSHEIRTPMNGVLGMLELALDTTLSLEQREFVETARASAESLLGIIDDILDFSKIEAERLELDPVPFSLGDSLGELLGPLALRAHDKGLELAVEVDPDVPDRLIGDAGRVRQVLLNIVGNAIKFTARGEIVVRVSVEEWHDRATGGDDVLLRFSVRDTGVGIPPEKQRLVFDAFQQADTSTTRQYGGTGLGLAIATRLAALLGGRLWVESEAGNGSTFHFTVRLQAAEAAAEQMAETCADLAGLRVLMVDDNATSRRIVEQLLRGWRMCPSIASDGAHALVLLADARRRGEPHALVITDADMPGMDGFTLVDRLREDPALRVPTVLMLSSARQRGELARSPSLGIDAWLVKPVRRAGLLASIRLALDTERRAPVQEPSRAAASTSGAGTSLRVLLAEDNAVNQVLVQRVLERAGFAVRTVSDGRQAVEAARRERFDVVLMDVQMPELSGLEATQRIRAHERERSARPMPIVALTARAMAGDRDACLAAGMDAYLSKPLRGDELVATVVRLAAEAAEATESATPSTNSAAALPGAPDAHVLDESALMELVADDRALLSELAALFAADARTHVAAMQAALRMGDAEALLEAAHSVKGAAGSLTAMAVARVAEELERMGQSRSLAGAAPLLGTMETELERTHGRLRALIAAA